MNMSWPEWRKRVEILLEAYLRKTRLTNEGDAEEAAYGSWADCFKSGMTPQEAVKHCTSEEVDHFYTLFDSGISYLKPESAKTLDCFGGARWYLDQLERNDILPASQITHLENAWNTGEHQFVITKLKQMRDTYKNPSQPTPTRDEAAQAAETLLRCNQGDLEKWTDGILPDAILTTGLKAISKRIKP